MLLQLHRRRQEPSQRLAQLPDDVGRRRRPAASRFLDRRQQPETPGPAEPRHPLEEERLQQELPHPTAAKECKISLWHILYILSFFKVATTLVDPLFIELMPIEVF